MSNQQIHLGSTLDPATLDSLADFVCGDNTARFPEYRSSMYLTKFFQDIGINVTHDGSTRKWWVLSVLQGLKPQDLERVVLRLVDLREYKADREKLRLAVQTMNAILAIDNLAVNFDGAKPELVRASPVALNDLLKPAPAASAGDEAQFLKQQFGDTLNIDDLKLDPAVTPYLQARVDEVQACPRDKVALGTIFLLGSTLEESS